MSDAEWLRNLARNYADGVAGMEPQDHPAWAIADELERMRARIAELEKRSITSFILDEGKT